MVANVISLPFTLEDVHRAGNTRIVSLRALHLMSIRREARRLEADQV